jgi:hypothetical protein
MPLTIENILKFEELTKNLEKNAANLAFGSVPQSMAMEVPQLMKKKTDHSKSKTHITKDNMHKLPSVRTIQKKKTLKQIKAEEELENKAIVISKKKLTEEEDANMMHLDRESEVLISHFLKMCQEKNLRQAKLTRGKFKAFLTIRYKGQVTDKISQFFFPYFNVPMDFEFFCDVFEKFMNTHVEKIKKMVHSIYDFNDDKYICELDIYSFIKVFEEDNPELFMQVYLEDII